MRGSNLVDIFCGGVHGLLMNCVETVLAVAQSLGKLLIVEYGDIVNILKLCEIIVFIIYVPGISV